MLVERMPWLLPPLDFDAALGVTAIRSVAGTIPADSPLIVGPPFQDPHHPATVVQGRVTSRVSLLPSRVRDRRCGPAVR